MEKELKHITEEKEKEILINIENEIARLDREEKKLWKIYTISTFLIVIFEIVFLLWVKSMLVSGSLGFILGMFVATWTDRIIRKGFRK